MTEAPPILFTWTGDSFSPAGSHWAKQADKHFVIGERYALIEHQERSQKSHAHYFAMVNDAWQSLPEHLAEQYPTSERLRKHCLIKAGYADSQTFVCASKAEAQRMAAFIRPIDEFSIVSVKEATVTRWTAKSQSVKAMGREDFQRSKDAVLQVLSDMIGTTPSELQKAKAA